MTQKYIPIAKIVIPAIGAVTGWIRTEKTVYVSASTPAWMLGIISDLRKEY